jgi:hypothetical protein
VPGNSNKSFGMMVARDGVEPPTPAFSELFFNQQLNSSTWPQFCDHSVTSADVRLASAPNLSRTSVRGLDLLARVARQRPALHLPQDRQSALGSLHLARSRGQARSSSEQERSNFCAGVFLVRKTIQTTFRTSISNRRKRRPRRFFEHPHRE